MPSRYVLSIFSFLVFSQASFSAGEDSNVVITDDKELHEFVWQRNKNSVQVKQTISTTYSINYFAISLPILETYSDKTAIDDIDLSVNNKKVNNIKPQYSYFEEDGRFFSDQRLCYFNLP